MRALLIALLLPACTFYQEPIQRSSDGISIKAGKFRNPGDEAAAHCKKFGKIAISKRVDAVDNNMAIYQYECR